MQKPNFFLMGSKSGTTSFWAYLKDHPNICMSKIKEPRYFCSEWSERYRNAKTLEEYFGFFECGSKEVLAIGEATSSYLFSSRAMEKIYEFNKNAKIIVMLRNPVEVVFQFHSMFAWHSMDDEPEFEKAWRLQESRKEGKNIPELCEDPEFLQYKKIGLIGTNLEKVLRIFPPEQVKMILFEDFVSNTREVYEDVLSFLGVPSDNRTEFPHMHETKRHKIHAVGKLLCAIPSSVSSGVKFLKKIFGVKKRLNLMPKIHKLNTGIISFDDLDEKFRLELIDEFREEIQKISRLTNRDLNHWLG